MLLECSSNKQLVSLKRRRSVRFELDALANVDDDRELMRRINFPLFRERELYIAISLHFILVVLKFMIVLGRSNDLKREK